MRGSRYIVWAIVFGFVLAAGYALGEIFQAIDRWQPY